MKTSPCLISSRYEPAKDEARTSERFVSPSNPSARWPRDATLARANERLVNLRRGADHGFAPNAPARRLLVLLFHLRNSE